MKSIKARTSYAIIGGDFSGQEPRSMCAMAKDVDMQTAYLKKQDLYSSVAAKCYHNRYEDNLEFQPQPDGTVIQSQEGKERRSKAKQMFLGINYGMSPQTLAKRMQLPYAEAQSIVDSYYEGFKGIDKLTKDSQEMAKKLGYVTNIYGRRRHLPDAQLPEISVELSKQKEFFNPFLNSRTHVDKALEAKMKTYEKSYKKAKKKEEKEAIKSQALLDGIIIRNNGAFISRSLRQSLNARIQGCISGETRVQTKLYGLKKLKDIVGQTLEIWDGQQWTTGEVTYSGLKQECNIVFNTKQQIMCSPIHKFLVVNTFGGTKWVACKDLKPGDHVCINENYTPSNFKYTSDRTSDGKAWNSKNLHCDDIQNSFELGRVLGRLASDGTFKARDDGGSTLTQLIAEHEFDILPLLETYMHPWTPIKHENELRPNRNQKITTLNVTCKSLLQEITNLDIKHIVHENIFEDTELLRGFLSGFFDGDGGISGNNIALTFGTQFNFEPLLKDLQKALTFFGIRSTTHKYRSSYRLRIRRADSQRFANLIGFMSGTKQELALKMVTTRDNHCYGGRQTIIVKSVEVTNNFVEMYDVCDTDRGYYVADGIITHNTAATMTKVAMILINNDPELKQLGARLLVTIHDEVFCEAPVANKDRVAERLCELMVEAANEKCSFTPWSVDPYIVIDGWYEDENQSKIHETYEKALKKGKSEEDAIKVAQETYSMYNPDSITLVCHKDYTIGRDSLIYGPNYYLGK